MKLYVVKLEQRIAPRKGAIAVNSIETIIKANSIDDAKIEVKNYFNDSCTTKYEVNDIALIPEPAATLVREHLTVVNNHY